jgi:hypothetical protein
LELLHEIREGQAALAALSSGDPSQGTQRESLETFLAKLPNLWREGEARPTHRSETATARWWRTRENPFASVWPEILLWLQKEPDSTAKSLMERLQKHCPDQVAEGQLRTLQRRIREWRGAMARTLVHACLDGKEATGNTVVVGAKPDG